MPYHLEGSLLELCTCGAYCPCRPAGQPDGGECEAANAWHIDRGTIDGTDVSGLSLVALSHVHGHVLEGRPVVYFVDDRASDEQQQALMNVWSGKLGGPVADLAELIGEVAGVERAAITFQPDGGQGSLRVGEVIDAQLAAVAHEGSGHGGEPHEDICTTIPGSETQLAEAASYRVNSLAYGFALDLRNHQVMQGRFRFDG
jgi:hypothetical protein